MENIFVEFLPPWVETGMQPAFYDKESGTVLQQTARMYARVNMLIRMFNKLSKQTKETVEDYIERFNTLYTYVHDYFDNLDVQEEINNKLDAMVEDGTMSDLLSEFVNFYSSYDTVDDMIADEDIIAGRRITCFGGHETNDGKGGSFIITEGEGDIELANGLYATYLNNYLRNYKNIQYSKTRRYDTDIYITTVPYLDEEDKPIELNIGRANRTPKDEMPSEFARRNATSLSINCSTSLDDYSTTPTTAYGLGIFISEGVVIADNDKSGQEVPDNYVYIGLEADRTVHNYLVKNTSAAAMLSDGCVTAFAAYWKLVENSAAIDLTGVLPGTDVVTAHHPRQAIGIKADKTIVILTCDGRTPQSIGLTSAQMQTIFLELGCTDAWNLDGGGSASTIIKGTKINRNIDSDGTKERYIDYLLNVNDPRRSQDLIDVYNQIGEVRQLASSQLVESMIKYDDHSNKDLNDLGLTSAIGVANSASNRPVAQNGYIINMPNTIPENLGKYGKQIYIDSYYDFMYTRSLINNEWSEWQCLNVKPLLCCYSDDNSNTIAATNVYQTVTFPLSFNNGGITRDMLTIDSDTKTTIKTNKECLVKVDLAATIKCTGTGTKYIKLVNGDGYQVGPVVSVSGTAGEIVPINFKLAFPSGAINGTTNTYHFEIYGYQGDWIQRLMLTVESDR